MYSFTRSFWVSLKESFYIKYLIHTTIFFYLESYFCLIYCECTCVCVCVYMCMCVCGGCMCPHWTWGSQRQTAKGQAIASIFFILYSYNRIFSKILYYFLVLLILILSLTTSFQLTKIFKSNSVLLLFIFEIFITEKDISSYPDAKLNKLSISLGHGWQMLNKFTFGIFYSFPTRLTLSPW